MQQKGYGKWFQITHLFPSVMSIWSSAAGILNTEISLIFAYL